MHDTSKCVMGGGQSSIKDVRSKKAKSGSVGLVPAGTVVHLKSDDTLSPVASDGAVVGISMGKDQSNTDRVSYCERGNAIPALLTSGFTPTKTAAVYYDPTTGKLAASSGSATALNARYASGKLTGIAEDGTSVDAALIDFNGNL